jgi:hypothetical protein
MVHPDDTTIERFAMGGLDDDAAFIAHVGGCQDCSRKLQREATIELAMLDVQSRVTPTAEARAPAPMVRARLARRVIGPAFVFAAAAAMLAWVGHQRGRSQRTSSEANAVRVVSCPDGPKQVECIADAHRSGSHLEYPQGTSLAALGSEPGLTVHIEPKLSDGTLVELDDFLVKAKADLKTCAEKAIVSQDAPMRVGQVGISFAIGPSGQMQEAQQSVTVHNAVANPPDLPSRRPRSPALDADLTIARCLSGTTSKFPFKGNGQIVRVSLTAKYVWRE